MEENSDFIPMSPQLGVAGSSYRLQMGIMHGFWSVRLIKGNEILDSFIFKDEGKEMPNSNKITAWVLSVLAIPNINTFQIQKTVGFIRQKSLAIYEEQQKTRESQGKAESGKITLEKVPEQVQLKRPQAPGQVIEEKITPTLLSEKDFNPTIHEEPVSPSSSREIVGMKDNISITTTPVSPDKRVLPQIPRGEDYVETPSESLKTGTSPKSPSQRPVTKTEWDLEARVTQLEAFMKNIQTEVSNLKKEIEELRKNK